jgi:hypothetical protein
MAVDGRPDHNSRKKGQKQTQVPQVNMDLFVARNPALAEGAAQGVFFGGNHNSMNVAGERTACRAG